MQISVKKAAATWFALIIATHTLGTSVGGALLGPIEESGGFTALYGLAATILVAANLTTLFMSPKASAALSNAKEV